MARTTNLVEPLAEVLVSGEDQTKTLELLKAIFQPFIQATAKLPDLVCSAPIEVFKRRFKITSNILDPVNELHERGYDFILAGGKMIDFVNNVSLQDSKNDYDLWATSEEPLNTPAPSDWVSKPEGEDKAHVFEYITKEGYEMQIIRRVYATVEEIIQDFDIRACALAYDGQYVYWLKGTLQDIRDKRVVFQSVCARKNTPARVIKYVQRGYEISHTDLALAAIGYLGSFDNYAPEMYRQLLLTRGDISNVSHSAAFSEDYADLVPDNQTRMARARRGTRQQETVRATTGIDIWLNPEVAATAFDNIRLFNEL